MEEFPELTEFSNFTEFPADIQCRILSEVKSYNVSKQLYESEGMKHYKSLNCTKNPTDGEIFRAIRDKDNVSIITVANDIPNDTGIKSARLTGSPCSNFITMQFITLYNTKEENRIIINVDYNNIAGYYHHNEIIVGTSDTIIDTNTISKVFSIRDVYHGKYEYYRTTFSSVFSMKNQLIYGTVGYILLTPTIVHTIMRRRGTLCKMHTKEAITKYLNDKYDELYNSPLVRFSWMLLCFKDLNVPVYDIIEGHYTDEGFYDFELDYNYIESNSNRVLSELISYIF